MYQYILTLSIYTYTYTELIYVFTYHMKLCLEPLNSVFNICSSKFESQRQLLLFLAGKIKCLTSTLTHGPC